MKYFQSQGPVIMRKDALNRNSGMNIKIDLTQHKKLTQQF